MTDMSSAMRNGINGSSAVIPWVSKSGWSVGQFTVGPSVLESAADAMQREHLSAANMSATVSAIHHDAGCEATRVAITGNDDLGNFTVAATGTQSECVYTRVIPCVDSTQSYLPILADQYTIIGWI